MLADLRYVVRSLLRNRGFTFVTVLTLALGIGAAGAIFSATDWILFRRSRLPEDVYLLGGHSDQQPFSPIRYDFMVQAYQTEHTAIAQLELASHRMGNVVIENQPVETNWLAVSPGLFPMLGIAPWRGREFGQGDAVAGSDQVVMVSYKFWKEHLGGRDDALGRKIRVGESVCVVVGILAESQELPSYFYRGIYRPLVFQSNPAQPWANQYFCCARLAAGVTRKQAQEALRAIKVDIPSTMRSWLSKEQVEIASLSELQHQYAPIRLYWLLIAAVGCLYAIACLNASNLMLVRMLGMRRELGIRLALGGGRFHIFRLLALESTVLTMVAAVAGVLVANWVFPLLLTSVGGTGLVSRSWTEWTLGWRVIAMMGGLTVATGFAICLVPAIRVLRTDINAGLKDGGAALGESRALARLRAALVVLQAAFAVILLAGAGLMIRTFENFEKVDLGFDPRGLVKISLVFPPGDPTGRDRDAQLTRRHELQADLEHVAGVRSVAFGQDVILPGYFFSTNVELEGPLEKSVKIGLGGFGPGLPQVTGIRLVSGHWPDNTHENEILVNETLARVLWPGVENPVGQFVRAHAGKYQIGKDRKGWEIAGVVADIRDRMREAPGNYVYQVERASPGSLNTFFVRLEGEFNPGVADALRRRIYAHDPNLVVPQIVSVTAARDQQLWAENRAKSVFKVLAAIALLLAVVGVFAVMAYAVDRRMNEFGVRMALGAMPGDLVKLVMGRGVGLM
ncbi:MAG TPA: ABC transporter permease, partial [Lacunisphaera sp.]|nr:ABC transporter permease [Lacunisphaera sp.]